MALCALVTLAWEPLLPVLAGQQLRLALVTLEGWEETPGPPITGATLERDGWGRKLRLFGNPAAYVGVQFYSLGPDGVDEGGLGDDILVTPDEWAWAKQLSTVPALAAFCVLLLGWFVFVPYWRRPRDPRPAVEAWRAGVLGTGLFVFGALVSMAAVGGPGGWVERRCVAWLKAWQSQVGGVVRVEVSLVLSWALAAFGGALGWRLTRRAPPEPAESGVG